MSQVIEYRRPWVYPKQADFLFCPERYSITEASTKTGKTVGCLIWLFEQAAIHGGPGRHYWWVAPVFGTAKIAYRRLKRYIPRPLRKANDSDLEITLVNGAVIQFRGSDRPDSLYGEDVFAGVIDEASRCREEAWHAVRSTLTATEGPLRIIGNVKGRKNWAYRLARKAEAGEPGMRYTKLTAWDAVDGGILSKREVLDAQRTLPEPVFRELYLAEPSEDGANPFGLKAIADCLGPKSDDATDAFGVDLAKSVDWTVIHGLSRDGATTYWDRFQLPWEITQDKVEAAIGLVPAYVDSTGVGDPIVERLQKSCPEVEGYKFTRPSRQQLLEGLAMDIHRRELRFPDGPIRAELEAFEYEYSASGVKYAAPEGVHDDCVMGLALAAAKRRNRGATIDDIIAW